MSNQEVPIRPEGILERSNKILDRINKNYYSVNSNKNDAQRDAKDYANMQKEAVLTDPTLYNTYYVQKELMRWSKALEEGENGNWDTLKNEIAAEGKDFIDTADGDDEWKNIGKALHNLSQSL